MVVFNPLGVPLLNTIILLSSGVSVTWAHYCVVRGEKIYKEVIGLEVTILLGLFFSALQYGEYTDCFFDMSDRVFGRLFFIATGFHGAHVILGTLGLIISLGRLEIGIINSRRHVGLELSIWY